MTTTRVPRGEQRGYASPCKYEVDLKAKTATEVWNLEAGQRIVCPYSSSVYEDAPLNYLIDYAFEYPNEKNAFAHLLGLNAAGETIFSYRYPTISCTKAYRALPMHLENTSLDSFGVSQPLSDTVLTIYDSDGSVIATDGNWQDGNNALDVQRSGLAPPKVLESAIVLHLPARAYRGRARSQRRYRQCLSRGLRPRFALLSDSRVTATRQADTTNL